MHNFPLFFKVITHTYLYLIVKTLCEVFGYFIYTTEYNTHTWKGYDLLFYLAGRLRTNEGGDTYV